MSLEVSERKFEEAVEEALTAKRSEPGVSGGSGAREALLSYGVGVPGGFKKRSPEDYDRELCLIPQDVLDFIYATQPKAWERLKEFHGPEVKERFSSFSSRLSAGFFLVFLLDVLVQGPVKPHEFLPDGFLGASSELSDSFVGQGLSVEPELPVDEVLVFIGQPGEDAVDLLVLLLAEDFGLRGFLDFGKRSHEPDVFFSEASEKDDVSPGYGFVFQRRVVWRVAFHGGGCSLLGGGLWGEG